MMVYYILFIEEIKDIILNSMESLRSRAHHALKIAHYDSHNPTNHIEHWVVKFWL
jgi:hypothetical protein